MATNKKPKTEYRIECRGERVYGFIKILNGDSQNAKDIFLTIDQKKQIEKILNS